jgi:hypothetical protein
LVQLAVLMFSLLVLGSVTASLGQGSVAWARMKMMRPAAPTTRGSHEDCDLRQIAASI